MATSLYTKVRPDSIDGVFGNRSTVDSLKTLIAQRPEARKHVILLHGPTGCGKTTLARILAHAFGATSELSIIEHDAANTRGIDSVRQIVAEAKFRPINGEPKVYIIDESHQLTTAAQQAFLKSIEDCPDDVYYIFCTTDVDRVIKTVRGRCAAYQVMRLRDNEMTDLLNSVIGQVDGVEVDPLILEAVVKVSDGLPRNAITNLEKVMYMTDLLAMVDVLEKGSVEQPEVIELCKLLCMAPALREKNWLTAIQMVDTIDAEPESIRHAVLGFMAYKLKNTTSREAADDYAQLLRRFTHSTMYSGKPMLFSLVYQACCGSVGNV
jgi:DNA polymerase-3 subunit gamma/tau